MRISDWSSDVCSSDLFLAAVGLCAAAGLAGIASVPAALGMAACWAAVISGAGIAARRWGNGRDLGAADRITLARAFVTSLSAAAAVVADRKSTRLNSSP